MQDDIHEIKFSVYDMERDMETDQLTDLIFDELAKYVYVLDITLIRRIKSDAEYSVRYMDCSNPDDVIAIHDLGQLIDFPEQFSIAEIA